MGVAVGVGTNVEETFNTMWQSAPADWLSLMYSEI